MVVIHLDENAFQIRNNTGTTKKLCLTFYQYYSFLINEKTLNQMFTHLVHPDLYLVNNDIHKWE